MYQPLLSVNLTRGHIESIAGILLEVPVQLVPAVREPIAKRRAGWR